MRFVSLLTTSDTALNAPEYLSETDMVLQLHLVEDLRTQKEEAQAVLKSNIK